MSKYLQDVQAKLSKSLSDCWDEDRFIRGITKRAFPSELKTTRSKHVAQTSELGCLFRALLQRSRLKFPLKAFTESSTQNTALSFSNRLTPTTLSTALS